MHINIARNYLLIFILRLYEVLYRTVSNIYGRPCTQYCAAVFAIERSTKLLILIISLARTKCTLQRNAMHCINRT